jgi:hypothetical protein
VWRPVFTIFLQAGYLPTTLAAADPAGAHTPNQDTAAGRQLLFYTAALRLSWRPVAAVAVATVGTALPALAAMAALLQTKPGRTLVTAQTDKLPKALAAVEAQLLPGLTLPILRQTALEELAAKAAIKGGLAAADLLATAKAEATALAFTGLAVAAAVDILAALAVGARLPGTAAAAALRIWQPGFLL